MTSYYSTLTNKQLKSLITSRGGSLSSLIERGDLITKVESLPLYAFSHPVRVSGTALIQARKIVIAFHGYGAGNQNQFDSLVVGTTPDVCLVEAKSRDVGWFALNGLFESIMTRGVTAFEAYPEGLHEVRREALEFVKEVVGRSRCGRGSNDNEQEVLVGLMGFSQGAVIALDTALAWGRDAPEKLGIVFVSGFPVDFKAWEQKAKEIAQNSDKGKTWEVLMLHGKRDQVVPSFVGSWVYLMLKTAGFSRVKFVEHDGAHDVDEQGRMAIASFLSTWSVGV